MSPPLKYKLFEYGSAICMCGNPVHGGRRACKKCLDYEKDEKVLQYCMLCRTEITPMSNTKSCGNHDESKQGRDKAYNREKSATTYRRHVERRRAMQERMFG